MIVIAVVFGCDRRVHLLQPLAASSRPVRCRYQQGCDAGEREPAAVVHRVRSTRSSCGSRSPTYGGIALSVPFVLWQIWRFVTPGLHKEKRYGVVFLIAILVLFALGGVVAW